MSKITLTQEIAAWDGKSKDAIAAIYASYHHDKDFPAKILAIINDPATESGATWLLKAWLESDNRLAADQVKRIYRSLDKFSHWGARLHVLQCIPYMPIGKRESGGVYRFLKKNLTDENKFVRAWSYNGLYELSRQYPDYTDETKEFFDMAMKDEAASVKARIRNLLKKGF